MDPYYSPTEEEIADQMRAARRKFSNRFVPMDTYHAAMEKIEVLEALRDDLRVQLSLAVEQCEALKRDMASVRREAQEEVRDAVRGAQDEATWQRIQGDEYGSY